MILFKFVLTSVLISTTYSIIYRNNNVTKHCEFNYQMTTKIISFLTIDFKEDTALNLTAINIIFLFLHYDNGKTIYQVALQQLFLSRHNNNAVVPAYAFDSMLDYFHVSKQRCLS